MIDLKYIAHKAAEILPNRMIQDDEIIEKDGLNNITTSYDIQIQNFIIDYIKRECPNAAFLCEENFLTCCESDSLFFVIDPIDGTTNFSNNCKFSSISIAVLKKGIVNEAVVYNPYLDELFYAKLNCGAWLNDQRIRIKDASLKKSIVGFATCPYDANITDATFEFGKRLFRNCLDLRRMGSSALELCYAACGRYQLYCEMILYPWDYMAASLVIQEAGGRVSDLYGNELKVTQRCSVVAGCPTAHTEVIQLFKKFLEETSLNIETNINLY